MASLAATVMNGMQMAVTPASRLDADADADAVASPFSPDFPIQKRLCFSSFR